MPIELGYWKLRGLAGAAKVLLEYVEADWKFTAYDHHKKEDGTWNRDEPDETQHNFAFREWNRDEWHNVKNSDEHQNNFAFPNLPHLTDGDVHISQSTTILKVNLCLLHMLANNGIGSIFLLNFAKILIGELVAKKGLVHCPKIQNWTEPDRLRIMAG